MIKEMKRNGFEVINTINLSKSGYPDLICLKDGLTLFIECKEANDTLKAMQKFRIKTLNKNGFDAICLKKGSGIIHGNTSVLEGFLKKLCF